MTEFVLISDIHTDINKWNWECLDPFLNIDTIVIAGDISNYAFDIFAFLEEMKRKFKNVIWVAGNHDYYIIDRNIVNFQTVDETNKAYKEFSAERGIYFLENEMVTIGGVNFLGTTGWHDFKAGQPYAPMSQVNAYKNMMNDYNFINYGFGLKGDIDDTSVKIVRMAENACDWLENTLKELPNGKNNVVITHYIPHSVLQTQKPWDANYTKLNGSYTNTEFEKIIGSPVDKIAYWCYGHTHDRKMTTINNINFVNNSRGYQNESANWFPIILEV